MRKIIFSTLLVLSFSFTAHAQCQITGPCIAGTLALQFVVHVGGQS
jgi:hypothetical protein